MPDLSRHGDHIAHISHGRFDPNLAILRTAAIRIKPSFFIFPDSTTTIGSSIWLERHWDGVLFANQCAVLVHEAKHLVQYKRLSIPGFLALYAIPSQRLVLEKEAYVETLAFWILNGQVPNFSLFANPISAARQNRIAQEVVNDLKNNYLANPDESDLYKWIVDAVAAQYAKRP